jgi:hypothetical protein|tara:strand:+ start:9523 stop:9990 length:468 start_codon:yes stop_codon:yes gene_type:complete
MEGRKFTPHEFLRYIAEPLNQKDIDLWVKANGMTLEMSNLFFDFINSLYSLVNTTYLGPDAVITPEDQQNHFNWCWDKVVSNFKKECIYFNKNGNHYDYFWVFFEDTFYKNPSPVLMKKVEDFFKVLFAPSTKKTKSELDIYTEMYKMLENNLKY